MFIAKKVFTAFIMPPGIFVVLLFFSGAWCIWRRRFRIGAWQLAVCVLIWILSTSPLPNILLRGLEADLSIPEDFRGDVIILLGGGIDDRVLDLTGTGLPSTNALPRIVTAVRLQRRLNVPVMISGGKVYNQAFSEAHVYRRLLIDLGVASEQIIFEDQSRDTMENAKYSKKLCDRFGYKAPIIVTSAYHMKRSLMCFGKYWQSIIPVPTGFLSWENRKYAWHDFLPQSFDGSQRALKEYLRLIYTKIWL